MNTKELIEIARECCSYPVKVSDYHWCGEGEFIFTEAGLNAFAQRIEQRQWQRIAELTQRANKIADNLEQAEKRLSEIAFKACANLDTKDTQIAQLREALEKIADLDGNWGPFPETNKQWCAMAIVTAREALEQTQ